MQRCGCYVFVCIASIIMLGGGGSDALMAQEPDSPPPTPSAGQPEQPGAKSPEKKDKFKPFDEVVKDAEKLDGLFTLYRKEDKLYLELKPEQLEKTFYCTITMESGTGDFFLSGIPLQDFLFEFHRVHDSIQIVLKNVFVRTKPYDPLRRAVERAFTDSPLASIKIESIHPDRKSILLDTANPFLTDVAGIGARMGERLGAPYSLDREKTRFVSVKAFPLNVEIETLLAFSSPRPGRFEALPDPRYFTIRIHYSLSQLPETNYRPRIADPRVGYFLTAYKDFSKDNSKTPFVRYINRWHVEPGPDGKAKKPIVYWIENTVPLEYRDAVRDGVLMWNKAFERIGIKNAIEVRIQPDDAEWDADDVRYSTIRWIASMGAGFAMGPSWTNPLTGEILDADIIVDADMIGYVKRQYRHFVRMRLDTLDDAELELPFLSLFKDPTRLCTIGYGKAREGAFGTLAMTIQGKLDANGQVPKEYIDAYLRPLIAHEVGHTLGLRHNFRASTLLSPKDLHNVSITKERGLIGSVMDYDPVNIAPKGVKQGEYWPSSIGPYDLWAIEYGYKPIPEAKTPEEELPELKKIASRAPLPQLAYGTDEDAVGLDPTINRWDLSSDPLTWCKQRMELARQLLMEMEKKVPEHGESYTEAREVFDTILFEYFRPATIVTTYIGGQHMNRDHAGDPGGRLPFEPVPVTKQRQALKLLQDYIFSDKAFCFTPTLLNKLAPDRWLHWGNRPDLGAPDYPIHDRLLSAQRSILARLLNPTMLRRLRDNELKVTTTKDTLTLPELFAALRSSIWSELKPVSYQLSAISYQPTRKRASLPKRPNTQTPKYPTTISSLRRGLQREHLNTLIEILLRPAPGTPEDARTLAWHELRELQKSIVAVLRTQRSKLDIATLAHLEESRQRISKALEVRLEAAVR